MYPKLIFKQKVDKILEKTKSVSQNNNKHTYDINIFEDIYSLYQIYKFYKDKVKEKNYNSNLIKELEENNNLLLSFIKEIGINEFIKLIFIANGKTVKFPSIDDIEDSLLVSLCYYYKMIQNKNWEEIKNILNISDLNTIKYGIIIRQLNEFINSSCKTIFSLDIKTN